MTQSKGWDWEKADRTPWLEPAEDSYYLAHKWMKKGYKHILDLGCGLGRHSIFFARQGFNVSAVDISEYGINHLKSWAGSENLSIDVRQGDILSLDFQDNSFDCVFACHVISHTDTEGIKKVIAEIERCVKSGGEIFITLSSKDGSVYSARDTRWIDDNTLIWKTGPEEGIPHYHADLNDIVGFLANFDIEKIRHLQYCNLSGPDEESKKMYYYINAVLKSKIT